MLHRIARTFLLVTLAGAAALVVVLARQNRTLRDELATLGRQASLPRVGLYVPTFQTATLDGRSVTIGKAAPGSRQVLFVFNTTCGFCLETLPSWTAIVTELRESADRVSVYGISLDPETETREYVTEHALSFPVLLFPEGKLERLYRVGGVPLTLVLDHEGRILYAKPGTLRDRASIDSILAAVQLGYGDEVTVDL